MPDGVRSTHVENETLQTIAGTCVANAVLAWLAAHFSGREKRQAESAAVIVKEKDLGQQERLDLHEWWEEQVKETREWSERALKAEAAVIVLTAERDRWRQEVEEATDELTILREKLGTQDELVRRLEMKIRAYEAIQSGFSLEQLREFLRRREEEEGLRPPEPPNILEEGTP